MAIGRKTGGRTKGTPNKATVVRQQFVEDVAAAALEELDEETQAKLSPLGVMLLAMHASLRAKKLLEAAQLAAQAAPYLHPKLSAADTTVRSDSTVRLVSDEPMTIEQWQATFALPANDAAVAGLPKSEREVGD